MGDPDRPRDADAPDIPGDARAEAAGADAGPSPDPGGGHARGDGPDRPRDPDRIPPLVEERWDPEIPGLPPGEEGAGEGRDARGSAPGPPPAAGAAARPPVVIGWVVAADLRDEALLAAYDEARRLLLARLEAQFPEFAWRMPAIQHRASAPRGSLRPLDLLEIGGEEKLRRRWDYALVVVPNELVPRRLTSILGVPSSALETAVASSARLGDREGLPRRLAGLAQHLLGHLLTLEIDEDPDYAGPMRPPGQPGEGGDGGLEPRDFAPDEMERIREQLGEVADARLEERRRTWSAPAFYLDAFGSDAIGILRSILGYRPWRIPLYLGRLTAAVAVTLLVLLLTAESWEAGAHMGAPVVAGGTVLSIVVATLFLYFGQNLDQVGRGRRWSEQRARSRIVIFGTLLAGILSLWAALLLILWGVSWALPLGVVAGWAGFEPDELPRLRYVSFMATIGVLAAALGGNLEDEDRVKAELVFDDEV